jgi:hypothetical protein
MMRLQLLLPAQGKRHITTILLVLLLAAPLLGQPSRGRVAWNWYFGWGIGLSFASTPPAQLGGSSLTTLDGSATVSDSRTGNLLFYTDSRDIWDAQHQVMPNGTGLLGHTSSTQTALIVPAPGDDSLYYVFTSGAGPYVAPDVKT